MKPHPVPRVGDLVTLNDNGLETIFGTRLGLSFMKTLRMRVTYVAEESLTHPEPTFVVEVDNEEINSYLIDHNCFDIQSRPCAPVSSDVRYEEWGSPSGRGGIQRTLDRENAEDNDFLSDGIRIVDDKGNSRPLTFAEAELMGIRRVVASRDIRTGKLKWRE